MPTLYGVDMPIEYTNKFHMYRNTLPSGSYDMVIVSLAHQNAAMVKWQASNLGRFIKGSFLWVVHYNGEEFIDENELPPWAWLVRDTIKTKHGGGTLLHGIGKAIKFALDTVTFINCMTLTMGCVFIRDYQVPTKETICAETHELFFNPRANLLHTSPIPIELLGRTSEWLISAGHFAWQYGCRGGLDADRETQAIFLQRGFEFTKGCQLIGQVFPYEVAKMISHDLLILSVAPFEVTYCQDELFISTYSYWYSFEKDIPIQLNTVATNWEHMYEVSDLGYVDGLLHTNSNAYAVSKVPDDLGNPIRRRYG
jgi:hypothetical protein